MKCNNCNEDGFECVYCGEDRSEYVEGLRNGILRLGMLVEDYTGSCPADMYGWARPGNECKTLCGKIPIATCWVKWASTMNPNTALSGGSEVNKNNKETE